MGELKNELVWSYSRAGLLEDCPRAYWFNYYGSWNGWDNKAPPETKQRYQEKKLTSRAAWLGIRVHEAAEQMLQEARHAHAPDLEATIRHTLQQARRDIAGSEDGSWKQRPSKRVGFQEHYYSEGVTPEAWQESLTEMERQLRGLWENPVFRRLLNVPEQILQVEQLQRFPVGDAQVYVALDVLVADNKGGVVIIDWKTGAAHSDDDIAAQLGVYGLYVTSQLGVPADQIVAMHVNLRHDVRKLHPVGTVEIAAARAYIGESIQAMRAPLRDVAANVAGIEAFPPIPEGSSRCSFCNFRRSCGREEKKE